VLPYSAETGSAGGVEVVHLRDSARGMQVSIAPAVGNLAYEFSVSGKNALWFPFADPGALRANPKLCGIPFLAPWANRIDSDSYWVNGRNYHLNPELGNPRRDTNGRPIHGLLLFSPAWKVVSLETKDDYAAVTSRLEFWTHPELMAQFPFAHEIVMTHRLAGGSLEVETTLVNHAAESLPVAIGFHPYFQLHDAARDDWKVHIAARDHVELDGNLIPTGKRRPIEFRDPHPLAEGPLDDVFTNLIREDGLARFWVTGNQERITVTYGPKYQVAVVFAPAGREFICFEPMAALTNAFNLTHRGIGDPLQAIPPGESWRETFRITPEGF